jgi:hypothetical protein
MAGGVIDGQAVSQGITNPAFIIKNANDTMPHVLSMAAPTSGPVIDDVQNTLNVLVTAVGGDQSTAAWQYPLAPSNTIVSGVDTHELALEKLAIKFFGLAASGGHTHSGVDGDGATVIAVDSIAASGYPAATGNIIIAASGDIAISQSGQTITIYSTPDPAEVNSLNGLTGDIVIAASGGTAVGISGQNINIYSNPLAPTATAPQSVASANSGGISASAARIDHVHQGVHSVAASGSSAIFGDIVLAPSGEISITQSGNTITVYAALDGSAVTSLNGLSGDLTIAASGGTAVGVSGQTINVYSNPLAPTSTAVQSVGTPNAGGTSVSAARVDHVHEGVHSVAVSGSTSLFSDVTFAASGEITLVQSGQNITIYAPAAAASGTAVNSLNGLTGTVTIAASGGTAVGVSGQNINVYSNPLAPTGTAVNSVGSTNSQGTSPSAARYDHVHQGVHSIAASGSTALNGDVLLVAGTNITLSQSSQNITINSSGGAAASWVVSASTITPATAAFGTISQKFFRYLHSGNSLRGQGSFKTGSTAASVAKIALVGFTLDSTFYQSTPATRNKVGTARYIPTASTNYNGSNVEYIVFVDQTDTGNIYITGQSGAMSSETYQTSNANSIFGSTEGCDFEFEVVVL